MGGLTQLVLKLLCFGKHVTECVAFRLRHFFVNSSVLFFWKRVRSLLPSIFPLRKIQNVNPIHTKGSWLKSWITSNPFYLSPTNLENLLKFVWEHFEVVVTSTKLLYIIHLFPRWNALPALDAPLFVLKRSNNTPPFLSILNVLADLNAKKNV